MFSEQSIMKCGISAPLAGVRVLPSRSAGLDISHRHAQLEPAIVCCVAIERRAEPLEYLRAFSFRYKVAPRGQKAKPDKTVPEQCCPVGKAHHLRLLGASHCFEPRRC